MNPSGYPKWELNFLTVETNLLFYSKEFLPILSIVINEIFV